MKITVLMPVRNNRDFIVEAIESVLGQSYSEYELLIVDDGSNDGTESIISEFAKKDPRIRVVKHKKSKGLVASLNEGLKLARTDLVARMDGDDVMLRHRLEEQLNYMQRNEDVVAVGSWVEVINESGKMIKLWKYEDDFFLLKWRCLLKNPLAHSAVCFRKAEILLAGGYQENEMFAEDYGLWSRLIFNGKQIGNVQNVIQKYRINRNSVSKKNQQMQKLNSLRISQKNISLYKNVSMAQINMLKSTDKLNLNYLSNYFKKNKLYQEILDAFSLKEAWSWKQTQILQNQIRLLLRNGLIGCFLKRIPK